MIHILAVLSLLLVGPTQAQLLTTGVGPGSAAGGGGVTPSLGISGPASGNNNAASTNFTITLTGTTFNGSTTVTIGDGSQGGTFTPSVGSPGVSSVTVTPANAATSFTFTYTPIVAGALTLTVTNAQSWTNPSPATYTSNATYVGPGDVVSGIQTWYGLRAMSAADRGNPLVNVCNSTGGVDVGCADLSSDAVTGALVPATVSGIPCPGANCTIKTWYDRSGHNGCSSAPCNATQATVATRALLSASCTGIGSLPCADTSTCGINCKYVTSSSLTVARPLSVSAVGKTVATPAGSHNTLIGQNGGTLFGFITTNLAEFNAGPVSTVAATQNVWHALQGTCTNTATQLTVDNTTASAGACTSSFLGVIGVMARGDCCNLNGYMVEAGIWSGAFTDPTQIAAMNANQHAYWGF